MPREECPENQFILAYERPETDEFIGACVILSYPQRLRTVLITTSPSSFFYFSKEEIKNYHIINHHSFPTRERPSSNTIVYNIGSSPIINLIHIERYYSDYISKTDSSESPGVLGDTGPYYFLRQRTDRRYMAQIHTSLYSLLDNGKGDLILEQEKEEYYTREWINFSNRRVVLQIFPDSFKLPSEGIPEAMRYSALYKKEYGYENRSVKQTVTSAYSLMRAMDYVNAMGGDVKESMGKLYAKFGASYVFSMTTFLRNVGKEEERKAMAGMLKAFGNEGWDQKGQEARRDDKAKDVNLRKSEGGFKWLGMGSINAKDDDSEKESEEEVIRNTKGNKVKKEEAKEAYKEENLRKEKEANMEQDLKKLEETNRKEKLEEAMEARASRNNLWRMGCVLLLSLLVLVLFVLFAREMGNKHSVVQTQPPSALLMHPVYHIV